MAHHAHDIAMKIPWNFSMDFGKLPTAEGKRLSHCGGGCVVPQHMGHVPWKQPKTVVNALKIWWNMVNTWIKFIKWW